MRPARPTDLSLLVSLPPPASGDVVWLVTNQACNTFVGHDAAD